MCNTPVYAFTPLRIVSISLLYFSCKDKVSSGLIVSSVSLLNMFFKAVIASLTAGLVTSSLVAFITSSALPIFATSNPRLKPTAKWKLSSCFLLVI